MIKIINATNLLGDSIYAINAIHGYIARHAEDVIIVADRGLPFEMFSMTFRKVVPSLEDAVAWADKNAFEIIKLSAGDAGSICFKHAQEHKKQLHITEGYAQLLGYKYADDLKPMVQWDDTYPLTHSTIGIAPFSRSCSRHSGDKPNKTLDDWKWNNIIAYLRQQDSPIVVFCGPNDRLQKVSISEDEYCTATSFQELCLYLTTCRIFITVDNGLGHLASLLDVPTIILWPLVSCVEFIAPLWAPKTRYIQLEPNAATPAAILSGLRPYVREMLGEESFSNEKTSTAS